MRMKLIFAALAVASGPALAQTAGSDSTMCRLFPLACPGAPPPMPQPLYGPPDDQAAAQPAAQPSMHKHRVHKKAVKTKAQ